MMYNYLQAEEKQLPSEKDKAWAREEISDLDSLDARNLDAVLTCYSLKLHTLVSFLTLSDGARPRLEEGGAVRLSGNSP